MNPDVLSDSALVERARAGDSEAYAELYARHHAMALRAARRYSGSGDHSDAVQEAFLRVMRAIQAGGGPTDSFVNYLLTTVRRVLIEWSGKGHLEDIVPELPEDSSRVDAYDSLSDVAAESMILKTAFLTLPERWRMALWMTEVEELTADQVGQKLGVAPLAASSLAYRARNALRSAWLQAHVKLDDVPRDCRSCIVRLGEYARGRTSARHTQTIEQHLDGCARCRRVLADLRGLNDRLPAMLVPAILGLGFGAEAGFGLAKAGGTLGKRASQGGATGAAVAGGAAGSSAAAGGTVAMAGAGAGAGSAAGGVASLFGGGFSAAAAGGAALLRPFGARHVMQVLGFAFAAVLLLTSAIGIAYAGRDNNDGGAGRTALDSAVRPTGPMGLPTGASAGPAATAPDDVPSATASGTDAGVESSDGGADGVPDAHRVPFAPGTTGGTDDAGRGGTVRGEVAEVPTQMAEPDRSTGTSPEPRGPEVTAPPSEPAPSGTPANPSTPGPSPSPTGPSATPTQPSTPSSSPSPTAAPSATPTPSPSPSAPEIVAAPTIVGPAEAVLRYLPMLSGVASANAEVHVVDQDLDVVGVVAADAEGAWTMRVLDAPLSGGEYAAQQVTDSGASELSAFVGPYSYEVADLLAPADGSNVPLVGSDYNGNGVVDEVDVRLRAPAGTLVEVSADGVVTGNVHQGTGDQLRLFLGGIAPGTHTIAVRLVEPGTGLAGPWLTSTFEVTAVGGGNN